MVDAIQFQMEIYTYVKEKRDSPVFEINWNGNELPGMSVMITAMKLM